MDHEQSKDNNLGKAFNEMARVYNNRDSSVLDWKARGKRMIGCLGHDVPDEVLIAAGYMPVRIYGSPDENTETADRYLEFAFDPAARSMFEKIVNGSCNYMEHLVISNSSDVLVRVFYYLRQIRRVEPDMPVPPLYFFDFLFTGARHNSLYNRDRVRALRDTVKVWSGQPISDEAWANAIATCNENRKLLMEMSKLRTGENIYLTGVQALQIIGSSMFMPRDEHSHLLKDFLEEAKGLSPLSGVRIYVTGSILEQLDVYGIFEECGAIVVGEDHDWGSRHFVGLTDESMDPIAAISDRYEQKIPNAKKSLVSARVPALIEQVKDTGAQGVIFFSYEYDDASSWDYPAQKKELDKMGIPSLRLVRKPYKLKDVEGIKKKVSEFIDSITGQEGK